MGIDLSFILSLLAAFQLFFVAMFLFFHQKGNRRNNKILGFIFLLFAISMADFVIRVYGIKIRIQALHLIDDGFLFLYGPLIYLYTRSVIFKNFKFKVKHLLHLIPFILFLSYLAVDIFSLNPVDQAEATEQILTSDLPAWMFVVGMSIYMYIFVYLWFSHRTISAYRDVIKDKFSSIDRMNLDWLSFIIRSFVVVTIIAMVHNVIPAFGSVFSHHVSLMVLLIFTFYFVNKVLVKALNQPEVFSGITLEEQKKYTGSNLEADEIENYKNQLLHLMKKEKPFLNPELSLKNLADHLQTHPKVLSQVMNQSLDQKFYDFINAYRCEEVKETLKNRDSKTTISEAMYASGFNSKSSFNKEFKKLTGQTPSEFRKSIGK